MKYSTRLILLLVTRWWGGARRGCLWCGGGGWATTDGDGESNCEERDGELLHGKLQGVGRAGQSDKADRYGRCCLIKRGEKLHSGYRQLATRVRTDDEGGCVLFPQHYRYSQL